MTGSMGVATAAEAVGGIEKKDECDGGYVML